MTRNTLLVSLALVFAACRGHIKTPPPNDFTQALPIEATAPQSTPRATVDALLANFQRVHFETDSSTLSADARQALAENAKILIAHPEVRVEIQGHADERGTVDYNLALGQRRARTVQDSLVGLGVPPTRLPIITYGEERPLTRGTSEVAWAANRRAEFRLVVPSSGVSGTTM